jgi:8-oxo-dGTP pyrophosphatase MutT (NUDIX family)
MSEESSQRSSAAVLVLKRGHGSDTEILLIERSATVKTHQSQVAFPGGAVEDIDENDPTRTATRECHEEVGIAPHHVKILKTLESVPTLTSGFFVVPVLGELETKEEKASQLFLDANEVAYAEWVSVERLSQTRSAENGWPVFEWHGVDQKKRKVWGLTAIIFELIFNSDAKSL